jgi:hypothetical protein
MATIVVSSYMVRYPVGGSLSWALQWLVGLARLGHEVHLVERSGYPDSCFDPARGVMSDDCAYGVAAVRDLLERYGLGDRWCYVDAAGRHHGRTREALTPVLKRADLLLEMGTHGVEASDTWLDAVPAGRRVLIGTEPGWSQMRMAARLEAGGALPEYDAYYTTGLNVGTEHCAVPTAGRRWRPVLDPVVVDLFQAEAIPPGAPFTTVMNWRSHAPLEYRGVTYGQKDVEFARFADLPRRTAVPLELAVAGPAVPAAALRAAGWRVRPAAEVTRSVDTYHAYIRASLGEFAVAKQVAVATNVGWFSERSAAYLASARPVVMQETGFSRHLPCGRGLFAVGTADEAAAALDAIARAPERHARWARELAREHLDASVILNRLLGELGL